MPSNYVNESIRFCIAFHVVDFPALGIDNGRIKITFACYLLNKYF